MQESARLERRTEHISHEDTHTSIDYEDDEKFSSRIEQLLYHPTVKNYDFVDALYYDFSTLPEEMKAVMGRDAYLLFGVTDEGIFATRWVDRGDLEGDTRIEKGEIIPHSEEELNKQRENFQGFIKSMSSSIKFNKDLLSAPITGLTLFSKEQCLPPVGHGNTVRFMRPEKEELIKCYKEKIESLRNELNEYENLLKENDF